MMAVLDYLPFFHFIRPWWLLLLLLIVWFWRNARAVTDAVENTHGKIAPHLLTALTSGREHRKRFRAVDSVALTCMFLVVGIAGPTWSKVPNPLVAQTAPLVMVLAVTDSMTAVDVAPTRLERAKQKMLDLSAVRAGARTALVAYAGTSHRVVPLSEDPQVLKPFIEALSVNVMPSPGSNATLALSQAQEILDSEDVPGAMVFFLDELSTADVGAFERHAAQGGSKVLFVAITHDDVAKDKLDAIPESSVIAMSFDDADIREIERRAAQAYRAAIAADESLEWKDQGRVFVWPALLLALLYFRRGWALRLSPVAMMFCLLILPPSKAEAGVLAEWFFTEDQRGRLAFEDYRLDEAVELFHDPLWKGIALYERGKYLEAVQVLNRINTSEAAYIQGMANIKARKYRPAINAFEVALKRDPNNRAAARNAEVTQAILFYVEKARLESDTGTGSEGADEVVYDKEAQGGTQMTESVSTQKAAKALTTEQWMRSVDSRAEDFLRTRFLLESSKTTP